MKIQKLFLPLLILSMFFSGPLVQAQSNSEKEKEEKIRELEEKLEQALQLQEAELEKAFRSKKKINDQELKKILESHKKVQQKAREQYEKAWDLNKDRYRDQWEDNKEFFDSRAFEKSMKNHNYRVVSPPDMDIYFEGDNEALLGLSGTYITTSRERTALTIRKELDDVTFDTKFKYEVTEGSNGLNFKVDGSMDEGTLMIKLVKPGGEILQEIEISPLADISWNQDMRWKKDEDKEENIGNWIIVVSAKGASGNYSVNVRAN